MSKWFIRYIFNQQTEVQSLVGLVLFCSITSTVMMTGCYHFEVDAWKSRAIVLTIGDATVLCGDSHLFQAQPNYKYTMSVICLDLQAAQQRVCLSRWHWTSCVQVCLWKRQSIFITPVGLPRSVNKKNRLVMTAPEPLWSCRVFKSQWASATYAKPLFISVSHTFTLKHHPSETPTPSAPSFILTYVC